MSTDELERLERRLEAALHQADTPVDVPAGRARLHARISMEPRVRRWTVVGVAASVLAVVVATSLVLAGLRDDSDGLPVAPPGVTLSPSGLPVGVLEGRVDRTESGVESTIRMVVRVDGTGIWNAGTTGGSAGPSVTDFPVTFVSDGPGRVVIRGIGDCYTRDALTLVFSIHGRTVRIEQALSIACDATTGLADDLPGTTLRISPLPLELSPSGLPVGVLEGRVERTSGETDVTIFRLRVHPDGTGIIAPVSGTTWEGSSGYDVEYVRLGSGRVGVRYEGPVCASARALTFSFTIRGRTLTIDDAESRGCLVSEELTSDLAGTTLRIMPLPTIPAPAGGD